MNHLNINNNQDAVISYRRDIDGLRALAVIAVVFYHVFPGILPGGYLGVDLFFVLSGFLISTIIYKQLSNRTFTFAEFYYRRAVRLFPSLFIVLLLSLVFGLVVLLPNELVGLAKHIIGGIAFVANIIFLGEVGYFDLSAEYKILLHLWSLGVEEQFYIAWPLIVYFIWKIGNINKRLLVLNVILLLALAIWHVILNYSSEWAFYFPLSRFWELLVGAVLGYAIQFDLTSSNARLRLILKNYIGVLNLKKEMAAILGVLLLFASFLNVFNILQSQYVLLLPALGTLLLLSTVGSRINEKILSYKVLVHIGIISYPIYLVHWPILAYAKILNAGELIVAFKIAIIIVIYLAGYSLYVFAELPYRTRRIGKVPRDKIKQDAKFMAYCSIVLIIVAVYIQFTEGGVSLRYSDGVGKVEEIELAKRDWYHLPKDNRIVINSDYGVCPQRKIVIVGDSHAEQFYPRIKYWSDKLSNVKCQNLEVEFITGLGCPPLSNLNHDSIAMQKMLSRCKNKNDLYALQNVVKSNHSVTDVLVSYCWSCYFVNGSNGEMDFKNGSMFYISDGNRINLGDSMYLRKNLNKVFDELGLTLQGQNRVRVWISLDNPIGSSFNPNSLLNGNRITGLFVREERKTVVLSKKQIELKKIMNGIALERGYEVIDPSVQFCMNNECDILDKEGRPIYKDSDHLRASYVYHNGTYLDLIMLGR